MEGYNNPTIGIFAGLSKNYSEKLCKKLVDDNFINIGNDIDLSDNLNNISKELD